jgi:hypothetical protein
MKHSLGTAAIATGKSKTTIHRAIKSGKISAFRREDGTFEIDPSELHRVFEPVTSNVTLKQRVTENVTDVTALIKQENEFLKQQLDKEREIYHQTLTMLERRLDSETEERRRLTLLLTHQQEQPKSELKNKTENLLWKKIFRK